MTIEALVIIGGLIAAIYGALRWLTATKHVPPDPWGAEVEQIIQDPETPSLCHRCLTLQKADACFCPACGTSVGPYNNYLPFESIFSQGEMLRAGVADRMRPSFLIVAGCVFCSLSLYIFFAPVYWYFLFRNLKNHGAEISQEG